jgi:hypothetical protein
MRRIAIFGLVLGSLAALLASQAAHAQSTRTWVSATGNDANTCTRTSPCQTFNGAHAKTNAGGEINCIDAGDFGSVAITKSITLDCTGTLGGIFTPNFNGVTVNGANIIVTLRGISINGGGAGVNGVVYSQGARLNIEDCVISNFNIPSPDGNGIRVANTSGTTHLHVSNTVIRNNGTGSSRAGIRVAPSGPSSAAVTLENVKLTGNFRGIDVDTTGSTAGATVLMSGGAITHNIENGINVNTAANSVRLILDGVKISTNLRGVVTSGVGANTRIGNSVVSYNGTALGANGGGTMQSYKNNLIEFNGNNNTPITQATLQ